MGVSLFAPRRSLASEGGPETATADAPAKPARGRTTASAKEKADAARNILEDLGLVTFIAIVGINSGSTLLAQLTGKIALFIFLAGSNKNNQHSEGISNNHSLPDDTLPLKFQLSQNYPNPFHGKTIIKYCVAYKTRIQITIFDLNGKEIEKLVDEEKKPGTYEVEFHMTEIQKAKSREQKAVGSGQLAINKKAESGEQKAVGSWQLAVVGRRSSVVS